MQTSLLLLLTLVATGTTGYDTKGLIVEKSFLQSVQDCVEYLQISSHRLGQYLTYEFPPDEETKCLLYCVGTDLRWWNTTCGLQVPAIVNFFQPVQGDRQYEKRTTECLERRVRSVPPHDHCGQAYETFQCYFGEFGNLVTCPQYVPATKLQATQAALDCLSIHRVSVDLLRLLSKGGHDLPDVPETRCLYHCIDLRSGLYTPETGLQLSRFYVRDLAVGDLRYLSRETKACRDRIRQSGCNACTEVYRTHRECLAGLGEDGTYTSGLITTAARLALASLEPVQPVQPVASFEEEEGFSYSSYQRQPVPERSCDCDPVRTVAPVTTLPPPASTQASAVFPCSKPVPKAIEQPPLHRPQLVYYATAPPKVHRPTFSAFSGRTAECDSAHSSSHFS